METAEIRRRWLRYFESRGHTVVPSASLIADDPKLLFTVAGMVPFIPYLTGREPAPYNRATSVQKCVRTIDIEEVGKTTRHGTFFQMNGNFSFGDYFKEGAITFAWELVTTPQADGGYGFDPDKIWVTVYQDDDEAVALWKRIAGLPDQRIQRRGRKDNYWHTGVTGPGGPCSEIYVDRGPEFGARRRPGRRRGPLPGDLEPRLHAVPAATRCGRRRTSTSSGICRGRTSTPAWVSSGSPTCCRAWTTCTRSTRCSRSSTARRSLPASSTAAAHDSDVRLRVVADHVRSALMLIGDGVRPGNEGRGYVLRRIVRAGPSGRCACWVSTSRRCRSCCR